MKHVALALSALLVSTAALADRPNPEAARGNHATQSYISVSINGLGCTGSGGAGAFDARSWSWGASNTTSGNTGSGGGTGKAVINALSIKKAFDGCSPSLFGAVTTGRHFSTLTLTDRDDTGVVVATVTLSDVLVTSWTVGSTIRDESPDESVSFVFRRVCLAGNGSGQMCYDTATASTT
jgi:type VI protein secretion system component Hcp